MKKSIRSLRVESVLYTAINKIFIKKFGMFLSIVRIDVTSDLREVRVKLAKEDSQLQYKNDFENFAYLLQKNVTDFIPFRYIPKFIFSFAGDEISKDIEVDMLLDKLSSDKSE